MSAVSLQRADLSGQVQARPERLAFGIAVLILLIYSQAAVAPLSGESSDPDASPVLRAIYYPAYAATLFLAVGVWRRVARAMLASPLLIAMVVLAAISGLWSIDPDTTLRRATALGFTCLGAVVLAARFRWARLAEVLAAGFGLLALGSVVTGLFVPSIGRMSDIFPGAWRGFWFEKNGLGEYMTLGFCAAAAAAVLNPERRGLWGATAVACIALVLLSTSKTSLVALSLGAATLGFVWLARRGPVVGVVAAWLGVAGLIAVFGFVAMAPDALFAVLGKDATLTGRSKIWAAAMHQIHTRPELGFGYGVVWDDTDAWAPLAKITKQAGFRAHHAHNSWVEQALGLGVVGLALWCLWFIETLARTVVVVFTRRSAYLAAPLLVVYGMTSLTESVTLIWNDLTWLMFAAIAVKLALGERVPAFVVRDLSTVPV